MPNTRPNFSLLSVAANIERHKIASGEPWLLLLDLQYPGNVDPTATQEHIRFARNLDPIVYDAGDGHGPQSYEPFNFSVGDFASSNNGQLPELEVQASNVMRVLQGILEQYAGVAGASLKLYAFNTVNPAGEPDLTLSFTVKQTLSDAKLVHFKVGGASPLRRLFPIHMYRPDYCIWQYNSPTLQARAAADPRFRNPGRQCAYQGAMPSCSHTMEGPAGCKAHSNMVRFGAFPGIGTAGITVASA